MKKSEIISLETLHDKLFEMLKVFHDFCITNNLQYALGYGTCLGAVRHKDFIPWDDDADIIMPRPDYEKFIQLTLKKGISPDTRVVSPVNEKLYPYAYAKLIDCNTLVEENYYKPFPLGIFIDIFPLDGISDDKEEAFRIVKKNKFWQLMLFGSFGRYEKRGTGFIDYTLGCIGTFFLHRVYKRIRRKSVIEIEKNARIHDYSNSSHISCLALIEEGPYEYHNKYDIFPTTTAEFRNVRFNIPKNYDSYLTSLYGDYMKIPPEKDRRTHDLKIRYIS